MSSSPEPARPARFHVQTTASTLRDGFPYFAHHGAVSVLWSEKWRPSCVAGIYPFFDGTIEDFDPIFATLIERSGDDPTFLNQPDDYAEPFLPVAEHLVARADAAMADGRRDEARALYLRGAAVYRIARYPVVRSKLTGQAWDRGKAAYEAAGRLLDPPLVRIAMPFTAADRASGDEDKPIAAYLRVPPGVTPPGGWPLLLFICGLDSYRTDNTRRIDGHLRHGLAVLCFEIPGTGDCPAAPNDQTSPDRLMTSVLDWVHGHAMEFGLDPSRILVRGISTGGYYAFRIAHTHAEALFAAVAEGGGAHDMFDPEWIQAQHHMEYPFALPQALAWKFGYRDADTSVAVQRYAAEARKFSLLEAGILQRPSCRLLALNGMEDSTFPIEDSILVAVSGAGRDLIARGDRRHMGDPGAEEILTQWFDAALAAGARKPS
jgi:hypothetical protein